MIIGIGTDICEVERIRAVYEKHGERFIKRILTVHEIKPFSSEEQTVRYLAKRYAAKEAIAKAFGTGIGGAIGFQDCIITRSSLGAPGIEFIGRGAQLAQARGVTHAHVSLTDEKNLVAAFVILERC